MQHEALQRRGWCNTQYDSNTGIFCGTLNVNAATIANCGDCDDCENRYTATGEHFIVLNTRTHEIQGLNDNREFENDVYNCFIANVYEAIANELE